MESKQLNVESIEVSGEATMAIIKGFPEYLEELAKTFLFMNDMQEPLPGTWVSLSKIIKILESISEKFGVETLFEIGKAIPTNALL